jgi:hypothetical protein
MSAARRSLAVPPLPPLQFDDPCAVPAVDSGGIRHIHGEAGPSWIPSRPNRQAAWPLPPLDELAGQATGRTPEHKGTIVTEPSEAWTPPPAPQPRQGRSWVPTCLIGCLVVLVVSVLICGGVAWFLAPKIRGMSADVARKAFVEGIEASEMPAEDKQAVIAQVDRVVDAFKAGEIGVEEVGRIFEELAESPLFGLFLVFAADRQYIEPSGLTDEEKEEGRLTLQRVARGVFDKRIDSDDFERVLDTITVKKSGNNRQLKEKVTDSELRDFLADCTQLADKAEVPAEPYELDIGQEFERAVDRALSSGE